MKAWVPNCQQLKAGNFETKPFWGIDLASEHEKYLTKLFNGPVSIQSIS